MAATDANPSTRVSLAVNGKPVTATVDNRTSLLDLVREHLGLTGSKKGCNAAAGSALLANESLVRSILDAVVAAVDVPVTLKIRTGPDPAHRNAIRIASIAQDAGIAALTVHGRTRACMFVGPVEYETIAAVKRSVAIPVIANGDIDTPERARDVLARTGADAIMIGRAAQGRPWIFREIAHFLATGGQMPPPTVADGRFAKPVDGELIARLCADHDLVVTIEENVLAGGFGAAVLEHAEENLPRDRARILRIGLPDRYVTHGKPALLREEVGLTGPGVAARVLSAIGARETVSG